MSTNHGDLTAELLGVGEHKRFTFRGDHYAIDCFGKVEHCDDFNLVTQYGLLEMIANKDEISTVRYLTTQEHEMLDELISEGLGDFTVKELYAHPLSHVKGKTRHAD